MGRVAGGSEGGGREEGEERQERQPEGTTTKRRTHILKPSDILGRFLDVGCAG